VQAGEGIAGSVAATGRRILLPGETVAPAQGEPRYPALIAIPLYSQNKVMGVLAVYRKSRVTPFSPDDADTIGFLAEQAGVAIENVFLHEEARRMSLTDTLTGQYNRRYFEMQFRQTLATAVRFNRSFSVLMLDLDHFKRVNDTFGHPVGDAALVEFARRCRSVLREVDTFARYGGEEFICLLSETDRDGAVVTAEKIREAVRASSMHVEDATFDLTVSIGLASYPEHGDSFAALVDAADRALYQAKQEGRDRVRAPGSQPARPVT
jgi:diguanylate cyclase (GGDEF)-like protein